MSSQSKKDKVYLLFAFAYPSGSGLHVGHAEGKVALDILARYYRAQGKDVFFPVGWDAFGLPAENYAIKTGVHPRETTHKAIETFKGQIKLLNISYDWDTELATCEPDYYQHTQWLFLQLYKKGLAYQKDGSVNWCPSCQTVLANEQVINGECERCESVVEQKQMKQWYFKITQYQDELISGLEQVDWPEATKRQQLDWIGRQEGAIVKFEIRNTKIEIECFTTRVDTIYGVTFLVISPEKFEEMGLLNQVIGSRREAVESYLDQAKKKTEEERKIGEKDKTGINTGLVVVHPLTGKDIPLFVADYVLAGYGTGAVMGVPAHDQRDLDFALKHQLPVLRVIAPVGVDQSQLANIQETGQAEVVEGVLVNSHKYSSLSSREAKKRIIADNPRHLETTTTYKLRDWLISRQRYWGAPIPIVYDPEGRAHPVKEEHLPWLLPDDVDYNPKGKSPLASSKELFERTEKLYGKGWTPEVDTMDTFVDSSWYYLRYPTVRKQKTDDRRPMTDDRLPFDIQEAKKWLPVDFYMIGPEHIVLHLLYSRFFTKFLRDEGYLDFDEPFLKMRHQGMILGPDHKKMSKSKGNVINPNEIIEKFGADTLRIYEMFMGPIEADKPWDVSAVVGIYRFLERVKKLRQKAEGRRQDTEVDSELLTKLHQTIKKVTEDIPKLKFNTAIASLMEFVNAWEKSKAGLKKAQVFTFLQLLMPFAPETAVELAGEKVLEESWPEYDAELAKKEQVEVPVQVNGKVRGKLELSQEELQLPEAEILKKARELESVQKWLKDAKLTKEIYVPGKIVSLVVD